MLVRSGAIIAAVAVGVVAASWGMHASAQEVGEYVVKRGSFDENVVVMGREVTVSASVDGDVVVFGAHVDITVQATGDVLTAGGTVAVNGTVDGSVRIAAGSIGIWSVVGDDVMAAGGRVRVHDSAAVRSNAWLMGYEVFVDGTIDGNLKASGRSVKVAGTIDGDATIHGEHIEILPGARIAGNLRYYSPNEIEVNPDARIGGDIVFMGSADVHSLRARWHAVLGAVNVLFVLGFVLLGALLVWVLPRLSVETAGLIDRRRLGMLAAGFGTLVATPVAIAVLGATIVGVPFALIVAALYLVVVTAGYYVAALALGGKIVTWAGKTVGESTWWRIGQLLCGTAVLTILAFIPVLGAIALIVALSAGLGAILVRLRALGPAAT